MAFNFFAPKDLLLIPLTICEGSGSLWSASATFSGLLAFGTTTAGGFKESGRMPFPLPQNGCGNWWTDAKSVVRRSIVMDDYAFAITDTSIKAAPLADMAHPVATVNLQ